MPRQRTAPTDQQTQPDQLRPLAPPIVPALATAIAAELPAAVGAVGVAVGGAMAVEAVAKITEETLAALSDFAKARVGKQAEELRTTLESTFPERAPAELDPIVREELRREREFQRRMAKRIRRDLPAALREADPDKRRERVQRILLREQRYVGMRVEAMHDRALARGEHIAVREASPAGAYWWLSPHVHKHTLDCLALGHAFWPWQFLDEVHPPLHPGCRCELLTLAEAVDRGYMHPDQVPDVAKAVAKGRKLLKDALDLENAGVTQEELGAWLDELLLDEGADTKGGMVALYPDRKTAERLAVKGGEPPGQLHVTLKFLGEDHGEIADELKAEIAGALADFAAGERTLRGKVGGLATFKGDAKEYPVLAKVDVPGIQEFRARLVKALPAGVMADTYSEFKPHLTLKYVPKGEAHRLEPPPRLPLGFDEVVLVLGGRKQRFRLGHPKNGSLNEARWERRFPAGTIEGGQYMPRRGAPAHPVRPLARALLKTVLPRLPETPAEQRARRRGEWRTVGGRRLFVPQHRRFQRTLGGKVYTSAPGTTEVDPAPAAGGAVDRGLLDVGRANPAVEMLLRPLRERRQEAARAAAADWEARDPARPPAAVGGAASAAVDALRREGFIVAGSSPDGLLLIAPDGSSRLELGTALGRVGSVSWQPARPARVAPPGRRAPRGWGDFTRDIRGVADGYARAHGRHAVLGGILPDPALAGHAAETLSNGEMRLGTGIRDDVEALAAARKQGHPSQDELARGYGATESAVHEALHASHPAGFGDLDHPAEANLEEALTEELAHLETVRLLQRQGQDDVLAWRADHPLDPYAVGTYGGARQALGDVLDRHGFPPARREALLRRAFDRPPGARVAYLARATGAGEEEIRRDLTAPVAREPFTPILAPDLDASYAKTGLEHDGREIQIGDRVDLGARGKGVLTEIRQIGDRPVARVATTDGRDLYAVPQSWIVGADPSPARLAGSAASSIDTPEGAVHEGDRVEYGPGPAEAGVARVIRAGPDWALDARLPGGGRAYLTPASAPGIRSVGVADDPPARGGGVLAPTLDKIAQARKHFDAPPGGHVAHVRELVTHGPPPRDRRPEMPDGAPPLEVAAREDGRLDVVKGGEHVWAARANGHEYLPISRSRSLGEAAAWRATLHPRTRVGEFARKFHERTTHATRANMSVPDLQKRWATLDRELLPYAGRPNDPQAREIIDEQKAVTKAVHHRRIDRGGARGIGKPGGPRDVVVVGAGPAGLSAAIYGATEGLDTLLVDASKQAGGQARMSSRIENVLGFPAGITGHQLAEMGVEQAQRVGADTQLGVRVEKMAFDPRTGMKRLLLSNGKTIDARAVVIAGGVQFRKMDFPGADSPDVVYGDSTALKAACRGGDAVIVGGANSAGQAAIDTAQSAKHVTVLIRKGHIRDKMSAYLVDQLESDPRVTILEGAEIASAAKDAHGRLERVTLKDGRELPAQGVGMFIGSAPETDWTGVARDAHGFVEVGHGAELETSVPGVYAAGDVRAGSIHRVITAAADGAAAISMTHGYMDDLRRREGVPVEAPVQESVSAIRRFADELPDDEADSWLEAVDRLDRRQPFTGLDAGVNNAALAESWLARLHPRGRAGMFRDVSHTVGRMNEPGPGSAGLSASQQRVLDFLRADESGGFVVVPAGVSNDVRTFDVLVSKGFIEGEWRAAPLPPGSHQMVYRAVRGRMNEPFPGMGASEPKPPGPAPLDAQKLFGGELLRDPQGKEWRVGQVLVKRKGKSEVVTSIRVYAKDYSGPQVEHDAGELGGWEFLQGRAQGQLWKPSKPKEPPKPVKDDTGTVTLGEYAGGSQGARWAKAEDGTRYVVKRYNGDADRVATELLGNAIYRRLGVAVPEAGLLHFDGKPAVASRVVEGKVERWDSPSEALGEGFMADALLANWDVVGLVQDNVLWHAGEPVRVDQGGTLEYRAQGDTKTFGPVPEEVWSMASPKGQAYGTMLLTPESKRDGARRIGESLTPAAVDELVDAAPFADEAMRERVRENLKARADWMRRYAAGEVGEPQPPTGAQADAALAAASKGFELGPEEAVAVDGLLTGGYAKAANDHLRSGAPAAKADPGVQFVVRHVDAALKHAPTARADFYAYAALPKTPAPGAMLTERGYLLATTDEGAAAGSGAVLRLLVPKGTRFLHSPTLAGQLEEAPPAEPRLVLPRGLRAKVVGVEGSEATAVVLP